MEVGVETSEGQDMRFGIVRAKHTGLQTDFEKDGKSCPSCNSHTLVGQDPTRRFCSNTKICNALIVEETICSDSDVNKH